MKTVSLFIPCTVDLFLPEIGEATYRLLRHLGVNCIYHPEQTCCGQPAMNAGYVQEARKAAKHFIEVFGEDDLVVSPSGSCVCMVKYHYPEILQDEPGWLARAEALALRTFELSQYLVDMLGVEDCGTSFAGKVAYHESCHILRGLGGIQSAQKTDRRHRRRTCRAERRGHLLRFLAGSLRSTIRKSQRRWSKKNVKTTWTPERTFCF